MGNINDYGLPQMKRILGDTGNVSDAIYLRYLQQAVYELDATLAGGMAVAVTGSSYVLAPAPAATATLWNVIANGAVLLYLTKNLRDFQADMEGLSMIRDEVLTMNRGTTMREMRADRDMQAKAYKKALGDYKRLAGDGGAAIDEIALREDE